MSCSASLLYAVGAPFLFLSVSPASLRMPYCGSLSGTVPLSGCLYGDGPGDIASGAGLYRTHLLQSDRDIPFDTQ